MTEPACMANAPPTKLLPKTLSPFKVISATLDTVAGDDIKIHNTISIPRVMLGPYSTRRTDETKRYSDLQMQVMLEMKANPTELTRP